MLSKSKFLIPMDATAAANFLGVFYNSVPILTKFFSLKEISKPLTSSGVGIREGGCEKIPISVAQNTSSYDIILSLGNGGIIGGSNTF